MRNPLSGISLQAVCARFGFLSLVDRWLWPSVLASLLYTLWWAFARSHIEGAIGHDPADVAANLSLSVLAAFIFYLFVDVNRRFRDARNLAPYVTRQIKTLRGDVLGFCMDAGATCGIQLDDKWDMNESDIARLLNAASPRHPAAILIGGRQGTLWNILIDRRDRSEHFLQNLIQISPSLGAEGLARVSAVKDSTYLSMLRSFIPMGMPSNDTFSFLGTTLVDHVKALAALERWAKRNQLWDENCWQ